MNNLVQGQKYCLFPPIIVAPSSFISVICYCRQLSDKGTNSADNIELPFISQRIKEKQLAFLRGKRGFEATHSYLQCLLHSCDRALVP